MSVFSIFFNQPRIIPPSTQTAPTNTYRQLEGSLGASFVPGPNPFLLELQATFRPDANVNLSAHVFTDWRDRVLGTLAVGGRLPVGDFMSLELNAHGGIGALLHWENNHVGRLQQTVTYHGSTWYLGAELGLSVPFPNSIFGLRFYLSYLYEGGIDVQSSRPVLPYTNESGEFSNSHFIMMGLGFTLGWTNRQLASEENQQDPIREQQSRRRIRTHEQPDNSPAGLLARLRTLGIAIEGRFDPVRTRSLVENRELIERLSHESNPRFTDNRPIAVVIDPTADHNGAFNSRPEKPINVLAADSRFFTLYYQVSTETELREALTTLTRATGRRVHTLIIAGHGQRTRLQLGNPPSTSSDQDPYYLNSDEIMRGELDYLGDVMNPRQGDLLLFSCSNGAVVQQNSSDNSSLPLPNLTTAVGNRVAGIDVYSTDTPSNIRSFRMREDLSMAVEWIEGTPYNIIRHNNRPSIPSIPPTSPSNPASR